MKRFPLVRRGIRRALAAVAALALPASARAASGSDSLLGGDIGNAVFTLIIFLVVVAVLGKFAWKPLLNVLNDRETAIRESLESARQERIEAEHLLAEYKAQLDRARAEAAAVVEEGRRDGAGVRQRIQQEARQQADELLARARREIQLAADTAVKELYDRTADLAVSLAGNILRQELSPDKHRQLVADSLAQIRKTGPAGLN